MMSRFVNLIACLGLLYGLCCVASCTEERLPPGVVGAVNDHYITLQALDTMLDAREMGLSGGQIPTVAQMQMEYSRLLAIYILYLLVDDELTRLDKSVPDAEVTALEASLRESYTPEEFEKSIRENALDMDEWRRLVRYQRGVEVFCDTVLRPRIQISEEEVKQWFEQNSTLRAMPERLRVRLIYGANREELRRLCRQGKGLLPEEDLPEGLQIVQSAVYSTQSLMTKTHRYFKEKTAGACAEVFPHDSGYAVMVLEEVLPARSLRAEELYAYFLEYALAEKVHTALMQWVKGQLTTSRVRVSKHLQPGFSEALRLAIEGPSVPELVGPVCPFPRLEQGKGQNTPRPAATRPATPPAAATQTSASRTLPDVAPAAPAGSAPSKDMPPAPVTSPVTSPSGENTAAPAVSPSSAGKGVPTRDSQAGAQAPDAPADSPQGRSGDAAGNTAPTQVPASVTPLVQTGTAGDPRTSEGAATPSPVAPPPASPAPAQGTVSGHTSDAVAGDQRPPTEEALRGAPSPSPAVMEGSSPSVSPLMPPGNAAGTEPGGVAPSGNTSGDNKDGVMSSPPSGTSPTSAAPASATDTGGAEKAVGEPSLPASESSDVVEPKAPAASVP